MEGGFGGAATENILPGMVSQDEGDPTCSIDALPDQLLGRVLALAGLQEGPAATLVCKRWRAVLYSEPGLWSTLRLRTAPLARLHAAQAQRWFANKKALLCRVAGVVSAVAVHDRGALIPTSSTAGSSTTAAATATPAAGTSGGSDGSAAGTSWMLQDMLGMLCPNLLTDVELECPLPPLPALQALLRFRHLATLNLETQHLPAGTASLLGQLSALRCLRCVGQHLPDDIVSSGVLQLTALQRLELESEFLPLPAVLQLTALSQLTHLRLADNSRRPPNDPLLVPAPADFACLNSLCVFAPYMFQVCGERLRFCFFSCSGEAPYSQTALSLDFGVGQEVGRQQQLCSLRRLLAGLVPAGWPLTILALTGARLRAGGVVGCAQLATVHTLRMASCSCGAAGGDADAAGDDATGMGQVLLSILEQMPDLSSLDVHSSLGGQKPSWLAELGAAGHLRHLKVLSLAHNQLTDLPEGAYLAGLQRLDLSFNQLPCPPPALAAATSLDYLDLSNNPDLVLRQADAEVLAAAVPRHSMISIKSIRELQAVAKEVLRKAVLGLHDMHNSYALPAHSSPWGY